MTTSGEQLRLPEGLTEADLIDLADGRLPAEREGVVLGALKVHPELALMVKQMRGDAAALAELAQVRAPVGLAEGIESRMMSQAIRDLAKESSTAAAEAVPVSRVEEREPGVFRLVFENVWTRRLALAAAMVLVTAGGIVGIQEIAKSYNKHSGIGPNGPLANNTNANGTGSNETTTRPENPAPVAVAHNDKVDGDSTAPVTAAPVVVAADVPKTETMTEARAAMLAREGRLVVTVHAKVASPATKRLDTLAKAAGHEGGWVAVAMENVPGQYAMLMTPSWEIAPGLVTPPNATVPTTVASDRPGEHAAPNKATEPTPLLPSVKPVVKAIYTVELSPTEKNVAGLLRAIGDGLPEGATVSMRELALGVPAGVSLDPESVLWWNSSPGKWSRRVKVPVVVEGLE